MCEEQSILKSTKINVLDQGSKGCYNQRMIFLTPFKNVLGAITAASFLAGRYMWDRVLLTQKGAVRKKLKAGNARKLLAGNEGGGRLNWAKGWSWRIWRLSTETAES